MSSLSKIVITGKVVRNPEKRFTGNNLAITSMTVDIGTDKEEKLIRVFAVGKVAETASDTVKKGQTVLVDGRLQTSTVKTESGVEKKITEISAQAIEIIGCPTQQPASSDTEEYEFTEDVSDEELIGEDEIPF